MPIKIEFLSETRKLERGTADVEKSLDRVGDSLDDVVRDGDRGLERLERSFRDLANEARDTGKDVDRMGDTGAKGFKRLGETGVEVGGELRQNLGETFSSFRGDLEDLPQIAQDTLGGLAGSGALGGIAGLAATAAGAAGLGLIIQGIQAINEEAEASRERINGWAASFTEAGAKVLSASIVQSRMNDILQDTDGQLKSARERADEWGTSVEDAVLAMAGHEPTLSKIRDSLQEQASAWVDLTKDGYTFTAQELEKFQALQNGRQEFAKLSGEMAEGASVIDIMSAANYNLINSTKNATKEVDELGNELYTLPEGEQILIDAETRVATQNIERFKGDLDGIPERVSSTVQVHADTSPAVRTIQQQLNGRTVYVRVNAQGGRVGMPFE